MTNVSEKGGENDGAGASVERQPDYVFKIAVVGDYATGKTSLISRFIQKKFIKEYKPTLGVNLILKEINVKNKKGNSVGCNVVLWDIAGQDRYANVRRLYYKGCSGAMLVYDVTRADTFASLEEKWLKDFKENATADAKFIIVGNKSDLVDLRKVTTGQGEALKAKIAAPVFIETSAKEGTNVDDAFMDLIKVLLKQSGESI